MVHIGDSLTYHDGQFFSTLDQDNDFISTRHCARDMNKGAWWYKECSKSNLNGQYLRGQYTSATNYDGVRWDAWRGYQYSLKFTQMMIRPWDYQQ